MIFQGARCCNVENNELERFLIVTKCTKMFVQTVAITRNPPQTDTISMVVNPGTQLVSATHILYSTQYAHQTVNNIDRMTIRPNAANDWPVEKVMIEF